MGESATGLTVSAIPVVALTHPLTLLGAQVALIEFLVRKFIYKSARLGATETTKMFSVVFEAPFSGVSPVFKRASLLLQHRL